MAVKEGQVLRITVRQTLQCESACVRLWGMYAHSAGDIDIGVQPATSSISSMCFFV